MSDDARNRDRGNLFEYAEKQKPSQPGFHGDCTISGVTYEIRGWRREDQLRLELIPPKAERNTLGPTPFRGSLEAVPPPPKKGKNAPKESGPVLAWSGDVVSEDAAYTIRAFEKQGKSGLYFTLSFEKIEKPAPAETEWESAEPSE